MNMKYVKGRQLQHQPIEFMYGWKMNRYSFDNEIGCIIDWCSQQFDKWRILNGTKYTYFLFKTEADALLFKLKWG